MLNEQIPSEVTILRIGADLPRLREYLRMVLKDSQAAVNIPLPYLAWVNHLLTLYDRRELSPWLGANLSWEEVEGLQLVKEVLASLQATGRPCANCGQITTAALACEHCGTPLPGRGSRATGHEPRSQ